GDQTPASTWRHQLRRQRCTPRTGLRRVVLRQVADYAGLGGRVELPQILGRLHPANETQPGGRIAALRRDESERMAGRAMRVDQLPARSLNERCARTRLLCLRARSG